MLMSLQSMKSPMRTSAVIAWPDSLMPPSVAMCEWQSMMPGDRLLAEAVDLDDVVADQAPWLR